MGKRWKQWQTLFSWAPNSLWMVTEAMKRKDAWSLEEKIFATCKSIALTMDFPVIIHGCGNWTIKKHWIPFVYGVRKCSSFILLQVVDQFSQHHLLKRLSFFHCIFVKDKVSIGAWIYLWAFYFVPLIYISVFVPVPYCLDDCGFVVDPEVRQVASSSFILLSQDCFGYSRFFVFPYKLWN